MKEVFQSNPERKKWLADVVAHPMFKEAKVHAIAQHVRSMSGIPGDEQRIKGGVEILKIFETLSTEEPKKN
jgi:hypothetical protein